MPDSVPAILARSAIEVSVTTAVWGARWSRDVTENRACNHVLYLLPGGARHTGHGKTGRAGGRIHVACEVTVEHGNEVSGEVRRRQMTTTLLGMVSGRHYSQECAVCRGK